MFQYHMGVKDVHVYVVLSCRYDIAAQNIKVKKVKCQNYFIKPYTG